MSGDHSLAIRLNDSGMRVLRFPLTRFVLAILITGTFLGLGLGIATFVIKRFLPPDADLAGQLIQTVLASAFTWIGYYFYCATVEGRHLTELNPRLGLRQTLYGVLAGFGFISLVMLVIYVGGGYRVSGFNPEAAVLPILFMSVQAAVVEEIIGRGIVFRIAEEGIGTWWSVVLSALIFGFMHFLNPNATLFSCFSIALSAGVILAMLYVATRQLWIPIGLHAGWNFTLGAIYGAPVSGLDTNGLLAVSFPGPEWLTGGAFGPEASVACVLVSFVIGGILIKTSIQKKTWIKPLWRQTN